MLFIVSSGLRFDFIIVLLCSFILFVLFVFVRLLLVDLLVYLVLNCWIWFVCC